MPKKATQQQLDLFMGDSLPYEVRMMRETYRLLRALHLLPGDVRDPVKDALIESFCVHARNLVVFFLYEDPRYGFDPRWFTTKDYQLTGQIIGRPVVNKLHEQITHLSRRRTAVASEKIDDAMRDLIIAAIEGEVARLHRHLTAEYQRKWRVPLWQYRVAVPVLQASTTSTPAVVVTHHIFPAED